MLLSKSYSYINNYGYRETIPLEVSGSILKRANVPNELIKCYDDANREHQSVVRNINHGNYHLDEIEFLQKKKLEALKAIENFLAEQEIIVFGKIDVCAIQRLINCIDNGISAYQIEKDTGISRDTLTNIKNDKAALVNLQLKKAVLLSNYALLKEL